MKDAALIVMAKAPVAGCAKTRLSPPLSPIDAASIAEAALKDSLHAVSAADAERRIVALDGSPGDWLPPGFDVVRQRGKQFGDRLSNAFEDVGGPALLIGMDTPQVTPELLEGSLHALAAPSIQAVLGLSADGGWWAFGLRRWHPGLFSDVPMSSALTGATQMQRLAALGLKTTMLPTLRDIDHWVDVVEVAGEIPDSYLWKRVSTLRSQETVPV